MRIEWCRTRARAHRWIEECQLLIEEMRRISAYHKWQISWWLDRIGLITNIPKAEQEGLTAYANRQASIRQRMYDICIIIWKDAPTLFISSDLTLSTMSL